MAGPAQLAQSLDRLAASRQSCPHPTTVVQRRAEDQGRPQYTVLCSTAADSPVSSLLLSAFQEATTPASRAQSGQGLLPRGLDITVAQAPAAERHGHADQQPNRGLQQRQQEQGLTIQFTTTEPAAEAQVEQASRLFEAFWQSHAKAAKSDLHCRMRQRLGALRQQLLLARHDGS